jgi:alcohol dehydrogenase class IV
LANALCLPAVVSFNEAVVAARLKNVAGIFGEASLPLSEHLRRFRASLDLPDGLAAVGIVLGDLDRLADLAIQDGCHAGNPRPCSRDDLRALYQASL